jgi:hypothetical protein
MGSTLSPSSEIEAIEPKLQESLDAEDSTSHYISDLEAGSVHEKPESENNTNLVSWETYKDPANPLNWSPSRKWQNLGVISVMSLAT